MTAMVATVIAVPSPITKVAAMPAQNRPCASANTSTRIAPEQGRMPTAKIAPRPAPPAAGAGEFARRRPVGMAAMLVMDVVVMRGRDRDDGAWP